MPTDAERIAELNAIVEAVRERVRNGYSQPANGAGTDAPPHDPESGFAPPIRVTPPDLMPIVHARDAAQAKVAAIGSVNPRAGGIVNQVVQWVKKLVARALQWFVRDQIVFNRDTVTVMETLLEALAEQNRVLLSLGSQVNERFAALLPLASEVPGLKAGIGEQSRALASLSVQTNERFDALSAQTNQRFDAFLAETNQRFDAFFAQVSERLDAFSAQTNELRSLAGEARESLLVEARELKDVRKHWIEWRAEWEQKLATNEIQFLRAAADLQGAFQHRVTLIETNFREMVRAQHSDYLGALDRTNLEIQKRFGADVGRVRETYDRMIHSELRLIRMRARGQAGVPASEVVAATPPAPAPAVPALDYTRFAERFRGTEDEIRRNMEFYRPVFANCDNVLDIGCGRGEFLEVMRDAGVPARGIDLSGESVAQCRDKGLDAELADLFVYLATQPDGEFDGIFSSQVVEHLPPDRVPEMIRLCGAKLRSGGVLAIETPNPECLAIFATYFYLDPTHTRPMPHQYLQFCMEEAGLVGFEVHRLAPAIDVMPELASLPADFRERFFGGLDYAIIGRRI